MRSPRRAASRTLWVTNSTVRLLSTGPALELVVEQVAGHRVERPERLVHQQDVGVLGERARQRHALAHAAGQLVRPLVGEAVEVHRARAALERLRLRSRLRHPAQPQRQLDVLRRR